MAKANKDKDKNKDPNNLNPNEPNISTQETDPSKKSGAGATNTKTDKDGTGQTPAASASQAKPSGASETPTGDSAAGAGAGADNPAAPPPPPPPQPDINTDSLEVSQSPDLAMHELQTKHREEHTRMSLVMGLERDLLAATLTRVPSHLIDDEMLQGNRDLAEKLVENHFESEKALMETQECERQALLAGEVEPSTGPA